ncbi:folylpolyglutamate synthase/dihydrofolate synthase family protein [Egicoccus sp. AB-alg2]|uniref:bifunctional folylpolyglutamate synthase/dihydrofolate synthase n=1 Tax=Egicoccus sp. AB-alg2 TaxID=3242693 RepID=UPI00359D3BDC
MAPDTRGPSLPPTDPAFARALEALGSRGPGRMVPDLSRITRLAQMLGDPQLAYPSVHVTGTNGKGSVVRMVGALCSAAGLSAGTYTSPHLQTVRERLSLAGRHISEARFAAVHDEVAVLTDLLDQAAVEATGPDADRVTFFEQLTAMAYWWFADVPVDVGVFEVGMGGRWDATNLVRGDVAVINEIDVDHPQLGGTPVEVAREKVGIIKPGSHVVSARQHPDVADVVEATAAEHGATLWWAGRDFEVVDRRVAVGGQLLTLRVGERLLDDVLLPLFGEHQARNAALALAAFVGLTGDSFAAMDDDVVRHGLGAAAVPGRLEIVNREPTVVLDGAHNPHGAEASAAALGESFGFRELILVVACLEDKDIAGILRAFRDVASHVIVTHVDSPRAASLGHMRDAAEEVWEGTGTPVEVADDVTSALDLAEAVAGEFDGILVAGSLHTVGAARDRYLPVVDSGDEVVREPDDEDDDADGGLAAEADELSALLADDDALQEALDRLIDEDR